MLKILAITGALLVASVTAYRQDYLDCAKHGPLTVAYKEAKAKHDATASDQSLNAADKNEFRPAMYAAQDAVKASLNAAAEAEEKVKEENMKAFTEPLKAGADVCVAGMQACVDGDPDVDGTIYGQYGVLMPKADTAITATNLEGWAALQPGYGGEGTYRHDLRYTPKTSSDFDGWRECAAKTAAVKEACCDSFCGLYSPDMTKVVCAQGHSMSGGGFLNCGGKGQMTVLEMFAEEIKKVKEVVATKAADGTYTYECEAGVPFDSLSGDTYGNRVGTDGDMLNVFQYINDGSWYIKNEDGGGGSSGTPPVQIPFDENAASVFSTFLEHHFEVDKIADLGNPDCEIQMGCPVSAYDACARDHYYSCNKEKKEAYGDSEIKFDWDCLDKAVLAKCEKLKTVAPTTVDAGSEDLTKIVKNITTPVKCELKNKCEKVNPSHSADQPVSSRKMVSACCQDAEEIAAQAFCFSKLCPDQAKECKADTDSETPFISEAVPTCGALFFSGQTAPYQIKDFDTSSLTETGSAMWNCFDSSCIDEQLVKACYGYDTSLPAEVQAGFVGLGCDSGAATQFGSVVGMVAAVAAAMFN